MESRFFYTVIDDKEGRIVFDKVLLFCKRFQSSLLVYYPLSDKFLIYFVNDIVQINIHKVDVSEEFRDIIKSKLKKSKIFHKKHIVKFFTSKQLPDIIPSFNFMSCPIKRDKVPKTIGVSFLGSIVTRLMRSASFPLFISGVNKNDWNKIVVFYGGKRNSREAFQFATTLSEKGNIPVHTITLNKNEKDFLIYQNYLKKSDTFTAHLKNSLDECEELIKDSLIIIGSDNRTIFSQIFKGKSQLTKILKKFDEDLFVVGKNYKGYF